MKFGQLTIIGHQNGTERVNNLFLKSEESSPKQER